MPACTVFTSHHMSWVTRRVGMHPQHLLLLAQPDEAWRAALGLAPAACCQSCAAAAQATVAFKQHVVLRLDLAAAWINLLLHTVRVRVWAQQLPEPSLLRLGFPSCHTARGALWGRDHTGAAALPQMHTLCS